MTNILVVDDTRAFVRPLEMHDQLAEVEHSWDAIAVIRLCLQDQHLSRFPRVCQFDEIWLDFDLHGDDKGSNIARFVRDNKDNINYAFTRFYIHSFNPDGRKAMRDILKSAGITAIMTDLEHFENKRKSSFGEVEMDSV
jgi:hypothetical protein